MLDAGHPARFGLAKSDSGVVVMDYLEDLGRRLEAEHDELVALIFRGQARSLNERPTLPITGTSPLAILAGTIWATNDLADIPAPRGFPNSPIEALVRLLYPGQTVPALSTGPHEMGFGIDILRLLVL